nr:hypothetical protein [Vibrio parahaemolyticus]
MQTNNDPWVCLEDDEDDYVIDHFELRAPGRKPLILKQPSFFEVDVCYSAIPSHFKKHHERNINKGDPQYGRAIHR